MTIQDGAAGRPGGSPRVRSLIAFGHAESQIQVVRTLQVLTTRRAAEIGGIDMLYGDTMNGDRAHQLAEVTAWIDRGVDAIVVMPIDAAALAPLVDRAHAAGIRILSYAFPIPGSDGEIGFDHVRSGQACGNAAVAFIRERFPAGGAKALVASLTTAPLFAARWLEPIAAIEAAGGSVVAVVDGATIEAGRAATADALRAHPDLSIVVGLNDEFALGAAQAFEEAGKDPAATFICGQDGAPDALREVARGGFLKGTAAIRIDLLGAAIVDMSREAIAGRTAKAAIPSEYVSSMDTGRLAALVASFDSTPA
jgi:ABC-type sugar transport system substrate-binding protein